MWQVGRGWQWCLFMVDDLSVIVYRDCLVHHFLPHVDTFHTCTNPYKLI